MPDETIRHETGARLPVLPAGIQEKIAEKAVDKAVDKALEKLEKATKDSNALTSVSAICGHEYHFNVSASKEGNEWYWWNIEDAELATGDSKHTPEVEKAANEVLKAGLVE